MHTLDKLVPNVPPLKKVVPTLAALTCCSALAQGLSAVEVRAASENLDGIATAASEGIVSAGRLNALPLLRPGEVLEMVPGMIVTQHAGDGKANQYFLRGFNLDHGTDFATHVGGVPVNMPGHAHGQGYTDLNFLIPELVERVRFRKGPYHAEDGDFASAGSARIDYFRKLEAPLAQVTAGRRGFVRSLLTGSPALGSGRLLYALELFHNDGPWQVPEDYRKVNGVLRYSEGSASDGFSVTGMAYRGRWTSTDQVPRRAIEQAVIDRFGSMDDTTGGQTHRYSLSGDWSRRDADGLTRAQAWWLSSGLDLWSNFQYCLNDLAGSGTCDTGDQFRQSERRQAGGFSTSRTLGADWSGREVAHSFGIQGRIDRLAPVGLYATRQRETLNTVREDTVTQRSLSVWAQTEIRWTHWLRTLAGLRADAYAAEVASSLGVNSGRADDRLVSPKLGVAIGPWKNAELFLNHGTGFHSNDPRGATLPRDPNATGTPLERARPLVPTRGREAGIRATPLPGWQSTLTAWHLAIDSELVFVGDAGTTEPSRPSARHGIEWTNFYAVNRHLAIDLDLSWSKARFTDAAPEGNFIPGAAAATANMGVSVEGIGAWSGAIRLRWFGPRPLVEDGSVRSTGALIANLRVGYRIDARTQLTLDMHNLFDRRASDIEYWYDSQLRGEASPAFDRHLHPAEPRSLRIGVTHRL